MLHFYPTKHLLYNNLKRGSLLIFFIFLCLIVLKPAGVFAQAPTITSFSSFSVKPGDPVIITGRGFNTTTTNNIVFFDATKATVDAATSTSLSLIVPKEATQYYTLLNTFINSFK